MAKGDIIEVLADCSTFEQDMRNWCQRAKKTLVWGAPGGRSQALSGQAVAGRGTRAYSTPLCCFTHSTMASRSSLPVSLNFNCVNEVPAT